MILDPSYKYTIWEKKRNNFLNGVTRYARRREEFSQTRNRCILVTIFILGKIFLFHGSQKKVFRGLADNKVILSP